MGLEGGVTPLEGDRVRWEAKIANEKPDSRKDFAHMPLDQYHAAFERGAIATARINNDIARHQGATVTGQLQGRHFSPSALKNATKGESNDRETPTGLELRPKETDDREFYKIHHVQVKHNDSDLHVNGVAEEHVQKISGNLHFEPSGPILFGRGDVADRVGPKSQPSANVTGDLVTKQWYTLYTERPGGGLRYYDMPQRFRQHTHIERGQVTAADVTPW